VSVFRRNSSAGIALCALILGIAVLILHGCDESLPPRDAPAHPIDVSIGCTPPPFIVVQYVYVRKGDSLIVASIQDMSIAVNAMNSWDEVLQDTVDLHGTLTIWDVEHPEHRTIMSLEKQYVASPPLTDGLLTLLPGRAAVVDLRWYSYSNDSTNGAIEGFWKRVHVTVSATHSMLTETTDPVHLAMQGSIQLFKKAGRATSPIFYFDVVYRLYVPLGP